MRRVGARGAMAMGLALAACASPLPPDLPTTVDNGIGEQYGNYGAVVAGETRGPSGERCVLFDWDRPLVRGFAIRYVSESCESRERPGLMVCREISRTVIPIEQSNLKDELGKEAR